MKKILICFLLMSLLQVASPFTLSAQRARSRISSSDKNWPSFYSAFRLAIRKRDRAALRSLMTADFEWAADGHVGPTQAISFIDQGLVTWRKLAQSVNGKVIGCKFKDSSCWNFTGKVAKRTVGPEWLVFELEPDGQWRWARLVGD
jgi:hypothetical protein